MLIRPLTGRILNNKGDLARDASNLRAVAFAQRKVGVDHPNPFSPGHQRDFAHGRADRQFPLSGSRKFARDTVELPLVGHLNDRQMRFEHYFDDGDTAGAAAQFARQGRPAEWLLGRVTADDLGDHQEQVGVVGLLAGRGEHRVGPAHDDVSGG